jgi:hypothetical protein
VNSSFCCLRSTAREWEPRESPKRRVLAEDTKRRESVFGGLSGVRDCEDGIAFRFAQVVHAWRMDWTVGAQRRESFFGGLSGVRECEDGIAFRFARLAQAWRSETEWLSSIERIVLNRNYQEIIGLGREALPLILRDLREAPDDWFWALMAITGENPVDPNHAGDIYAMRGDWLKWADERGL